MNEMLCWKNPKSLENLWKYTDIGCKNGILTNDLVVLEEICAVAQEMIHLHYFNVM